MKDRKQFNQVVRQYIIDCIDSENYDVVTTTDAEKLTFLYQTFKSEGGSPEKLRYYKGNEYKTFENWIQGLPSSFNVDFENYRIIEIAKQWESIPQAATDRQEDKILESWFNFITVNTFKLFRKYKIVN